MPKPAKKKTAASNRKKRDSRRAEFNSRKAKLASKLGLGGKWSTLELLVISAAKYDYTVKGDVHPNSQLVKMCNMSDDEDRSGGVKKNKCRTMKDFYSSRAWKILRYQAFEKYGNKCQCCGAGPSDDIKLHVDHIKPRSKHPDLAFDLNNLQILCEDCNVGKINQWDTDWRWL